MKLYRESKTGELSEINLKSVAAISLTVGTILISGYMFTKDSLSSEKFNYYSSYSEQIESLYDVSIDDERKNILNNMQKNLEMVTQYENAITLDEKQNALHKMLNTKGKISSDALELVKREVAEKMGGDWTQYTIEYLDRQWKARRTVEDEYGIEKVKSYKSLDSKCSSLIDKITDLDSFTYHKEEEIGKESDRFVEKYEQVIKYSAKFLGKTSDKSK